MSAEAAAYAALATALAGVAGLNAVSPGPPLAASPPYAEIGAIVAADWGTKDRPGRELRVQVTVSDRGEAPARVLALAGVAGAAIEAMPRVAQGWELVSIALARTRLAADRPGQWRLVHEYRLRMLSI